MSNIGATTVRVTLPPTARANYRESVLEKEEEHSTNVKSHQCIVW